MNIWTTEDLKEHDSDNMYRSNAAAIAVRNTVAIAVRNAAGCCLDNIT